VRLVCRDWCTQAPSMRDSRPAQRLAKEQLKMMGPLTRDEQVGLPLTQSMIQWPGETYPSSGWPCTAVCQGSYLLVCPHAAGSKVLDPTPSPSWACKGISTSCFHMKGERQNGVGFYGGSKFRMWVASLCIRMRHLERLCRSGQCPACLPYCSGFLAALLVRPTLRTHIGRP